MYMYIATGQRVRQFDGHLRTLFRLQYDERVVVSCSRDRTVKVWDRTTGACTMTLENHEAEVTCIQYDADKIVSGSRYI